MPVQINEVIIKTIVDPAPVSQGGQPPPTANNSGMDFDAIEKVLEIIKEKNER
jgi:hypothetical protein